MISASSSFRLLLTFSSLGRNYFDLQIFTEIFFQRKIIWCVSTIIHPQQSCSSPFTTTSAQALNCTMYQQCHTVPPAHSLFLPKEEYLVRQHHHFAAKLLFTFL